MSTHMRSRWIERRRAAWAVRDRQERGIAMVWMALTLLVMVLFAGFAVDLSNWYLRGDRIQRAADAGALAGAAFMPSDLPGAKAEINSVLQKNGYTSGGTANTTIITTQEHNPNQVRVKISTDVPSFFLGLIGMDKIRMTREAVGEYVAPVPMGSPENRLGNDPEISYNPQIWSMVGGPKSNKEWGDRYQAKVCKTGNSGCTGTTNDEYAQNGYLYAIEVKNPPAGKDLKIQILDARFVNTGSTCGDNTMTSAQLNDLKATNPVQYSDAPTRFASGVTPWCVGDIDHEGADVNTSFTVRSPDSTDYNDVDNPIVNNASCSPQTFAPYDPASGTELYNALKSGPQSLVDGAAPWTLAETFHRWATVCTIPAAQVTSGKYILQVRTNATAAAPTVYGASVNTGGHNRYSMRAGFGATGLTAVDGTNVTISARGRLPLFTNANAASASFYLARVLPTDAGRTLRVSLYDMGDVSSGSGSLQIVPPTDSGAAVFSGCGFTLDGGSPVATPSTCKVTNVSSANGYQGKVLSIDVPIPSNYTCTSASATGCWIKVKADFTGGVNDVTTWSAAILGNPIRIVE